MDGMCQAAGSTQRWVGAWVGGWVGAWDVEWSVGCRSGRGTASGCQQHSDGWVGCGVSGVSDRLPHFLPYLRTPDPRTYPPHPLDAGAHGPHDLAVADHHHALVRRLPGVFVCVWGVMSSLVCVAAGGWTTQSDPNKPSPSSPPSPPPSLPVQQVDKAVDPEGHVGHGLAPRWGVEVAVQVPPLELVRHLLLRWGGVFWGVGLGGGLVWEEVGNVCGGVATARRTRVDVWIARPSIHPLIIHPSIKVPHAHHASAPGARPRT